MSVRGFRDSFRSYIPLWLANRPDRNVGYKLLYSIFLPLDWLMQGIVEGLQAQWPGLGTPTALPMIGRSRAIGRGEAESEASYAQRLIRWLDMHIDAGASKVLAAQIHYYLANTPVVRIVDRAGQWTTVAQDGSITQTTAPWDWDSKSNPERAGHWWDLWIIVYPCEWPTTGTNLASLVGVWGARTGVGIGHEVPRAAVQAILALVAQWKGAHTWVRAIVWSYDPSLFDPLNPSAPGNPDGTWGEWSKNVNGTEVPARNPTCRFWEPEV
jgi:hypothetical protein